MNKMTWKIAAVATALFACSSGGHNVLSDDTDDSGASSSSSGSSGSSGGSGSGSGGQSSGGSGSSSGSSVVTKYDGGTTTVTYSDAAPPADSGLDAPVTLSISFTVPKNSEVYMCQPFGNPFGHDVDIVKMESSMSSGSHHFFLFNMPANDPTGRNKPGPLAPCLAAGIEFHPFPFLSQQPIWNVEFPAGMGYPLVGGNGLMMNVHYLNTSLSDEVATATITIYPGAPGSVTTHVGNLFLNNQAISVPPTPMSNPVAVTASNTPIVDHDYTILTNWSHMHKYSVDFQASAGGSVFYDETDWGEPPLITAGTGPNTSPLLPLQMKAGTNISWTCKYYNPTNAVMSFGDSAKTDDMCIYMGLYYPVEGTPATNPNYPDVINAIQF